MNNSGRIFLDAGLFIGALLKGDKRHGEARPLVESARHGGLSACTTTSVLSEVYAALTWVNAQPVHSPSAASGAVRLLVEPPSQIEVLGGELQVALEMLALAEKNELTARRIHDARHAAMAMNAGITSIFTYDTADWSMFVPDGLVIAGPPSVLPKTT